MQQGIGARRQRKLHRINCNQCIAKPAWVVFASLAGGKRHVVFKGSLPAACIASGTSGEGRSAHSNRRTRAKPLHTRLHGGKLTLAATRPAKVSMNGQC